MSKNIITISREYGSGGREIGQKLADLLEYKFYDNKLLELASKQSGITQSHFEANDETRTNSLLYLLSTAYGQGGIPFDDELFFAQQKTIRSIAADGKCIIIGRCADYALRDNPHAVHIFIYADFNTRVQRAVDTYKIQTKHAEEYVKHIDKQRTSYYNYYSDTKWGKPQNYDLCIDSGKISSDNAVKLIYDYLKYANN